MLLSFAMFFLAFVMLNWAGIVQGQDEAGGCGV